MKPKYWLFIAGLLGALGVGLGAYGAHGLLPAVERVVGERSAAEANSNAAAEVAKRVENWSIGVRYQMTHVLALFAVALAASRWPKPCWNVAGVLFVAGIAMFSGVNYAQTLDLVSGWGLVVMFGGISYIAGWIAVAVAAMTICDDL